MADLFLRHKDLTDRILRGFYDVYNELGSGYVESVYEAALYLALVQADLRVERQSPIAVWYRGHQVGRFRADLVQRESPRLCRGGTQSLTVPEIKGSSLS